LAHSRGRGGQARELSSRQLSKVAAFFVNRTSDGAAFLLCGFAERLLCLGFLTTSSVRVCTSCFLHSCRCVLALFRGSRRFGYRAGHIHQEPNRASLRIRQIHPFWSALVCDCHGGLRRRPLRHGQLCCEDCAVVDSWTAILGLLCGVRAPCCCSKPGYNNKVALGCGSAGHHDFFCSDDSHPRSSRSSSRQDFPRPPP